MYFRKKESGEKEERTAVVIGAATSPTVQLSGTRNHCTVSVLHQVSISTARSRQANAAGTYNTLLLTLTLLTLTLLTTDTGAP